MPVERELKFRTPAGAASRLWGLLPGSPVVRRRTVESIYYDTADRRLRAARAALRLRRDGRRWLVTFKCEQLPGSGLAQRSEWEVPTSRNQLALGALPLAEIRKAAHVDLQRLERRLVPLFVTSFVRHSADVCLPPGTAVAVSLDAGEIVAGRRRALIEELELELREGNLGAMLTFAEGLVEPLALQLEPLSKAERGYRLAARERRSPVKGRWPSLDRSETAEIAMLAVLHACLAQVEGNVFGFLHATDPEYLHQLRVGLRRMRSALRSFEGVGERKAIRALSTRLRGLMPELGMARDWDVFFAQIAEAQDGAEPQLAGLVRRARARRSAARKRARAMAGSAHFQLTLLGALRWMHEAPWRVGPDQAPRLVRYTARVLGRLEHKLSREGERIEWGNAVQRHRLRIRVKRLRYAYEPFVELFGKDRARRYLDRLEALQDVLGELNDVAVGRRLLSEIGDGRQAPEKVFMHGWFAGREVELLQRLGQTWRAWRKAKRPW